MKSIMWIYVYMCVISRMLCWRLENVLFQKIEEIQMCGLYHTFRADYQNGRTSEMNLNPWMLPLIHRGGVQWGASKSRIFAFFRKLSKSKCVVYTICFKLTTKTAERVKWILTLEIWRGAKGGVHRGGVQSAGGCPLCFYTMCRICNS